MKDFGQVLLNWYLKNKRDLPWRKTKDPYKIWISEIILQQTRISQGTDYYNRFIFQYPTIKSLSNANMDAVLKLWQGLGYYSRARNIHETAKTITQYYNGVFPETYDKILKLKGVGEYTAAAIASIAFDEPVAVVDGNVFRVLSRFMCIKKPIDSTDGKKIFKLIACQLMHKSNPGDYNQAIMELGALLCTFQSPQCGFCPLKKDCCALRNDCISEFPVRSHKKEPRNRYFNYLVIHDNKEILINKRKEKDIWQELYEFPNLESSRFITINEIKKIKEWKWLWESKTKPTIHISDQFVHKLTHQTIHAVFIEIELTKISKEIELFRKIAVKDFRKLAIHRLIDIYINKHPLFKK